MVNNLRDQPDNTFFKEEEPSLEAPEQKSSRDRRPGMTPFQGFVLSVMFFIVICLLGFTLLIFTGRIDPSFLY
jgi:hypothetical protein